MSKKTEEDKFLIFLLWGRDAQELNTIIGDKHIVMKWCHPSPLAQGSLPLEKQFVSCTHFDDVNEIVTPPIDWDPVGSPLYIYTDGSCTKERENTSPVGGWAYLVCGGIHDGTLEYGETCGEITKPTNQRSEGTAIINAFQFILNKRIMCDVTIVTDSQFYINVITKWMHSWYEYSPTFEKKKDGEIKNRDLIKTLYELYGKITKRINLRFDHIHSHQKAPENTSSLEYYHWYGNYIVDKYAAIGQNDKK